MKKREFHLGPGAASLMMIAVVLSLSVLGMLCLMSARSDHGLMERSMDVAGEVAELNVQAERSLAALDAALAKCAHAQSDEEYLSLAEKSLPGGMTMEGRTVFWTEAGAEGRGLECAAELAPLGDFPRAKWTIHRHWAGFGGME